MRYGSGAEDFGGEAAAIAADRARREEAARKLAAYNQDLRKSSGLEGEAERATVRRSRAAAEAADFERREAEATRIKTDATNADTAAIERNAAARQRAAASERMQLVPRQEFIPGATGGGPLYGQYPYAPRSQPLPPPVPRVVQEAPAALYGSGDRIRRAQIEADRATIQAAENTRLEAQAAGQATGNLRALEAQTLRVAGATREAAVIQRLYSDEMHRHGALTAEFVQAAIRGEVSLRQLGNEMVVTIGKFAGWTAAATLLYGAARAIGAVGKGAIDAQSGVHTLDRVINNVDPRTAVRAFSDLSKQFNVPIGDAVDAVYRMGQVFHNQADAVTAAKAALYSYKTGEVDVATSTQNLIAIQRGFGLSANDLLSIYNQINQAQNVFGVRIGDTEKGLGNAAGTWRNAGGDLTYLLSLFTAINKATAQSGNTIGTAVNRAVTQFRTPKHAGILQAMGVEYDPANLQKTIESAITVAQRATTTGLQRRELAQALFGNQYARLIEPVLNDPRILRQAQQRLDPSRRDVQTSAARELAKVLQQVDQQLKSIGNTMQRIGAQMQQAGLFGFAGLFLKGITGVLGAVEQLLKLFNFLPSPLTHTLALIGEIALAMKALGRFGFGERLQGVPLLGAFVNPGSRLRSQAVSDTRVAEEAARRDLESQANAYAQARSRQRFNLAQHGPVIADYERSVAAGTAPGVGTEERKLLDGHIAALRGSLAADEEASLNAQRRVVVSRALLAEDEANLAAVKAANARNIEAVLAQRGLRVTPLIGATPPGVLPTPATGSEFLAQTEARGAIVTNSVRAEAAMSRMNALLISATPVLGRMGRTGELLDSAAARSAAVTGRAITSLGRGGTSMRGFLGRVNGLVSGLGAFDYALIGIPVLYELHNQLQAAGNNVARELDALDMLGQPTSNQQLQSSLQRARQKAHEGPSFFTRLASTGATGAFFGLVAREERFLGLDAQSPAEVQTQRQRAAGLSADELQRLQATRARDAARGPDRAVSNRFASDVVVDINAAASAAKAGRLPQAELAAALKRYGIEVQTAYQPTREQAASMRDALANLAALSANLTDFSAALAKLDDKGFQAAVQATASTLGQFGQDTGVGRLALEHLRAEYTDAARRFSGGDAASLESMAKFRAQFFQTIDALVQNGLQDGLLFARNESERQQSFEQARQTLERQLTVTSTTTLRRGGQTITTRVPRDAAAERHLREQQAQLRQQAYQDREQARQIGLAYQQSQSADPQRNATLAVQTARRQVQDARDSFGRGSRQYRQALTGLNQARTQVAQALLANVQAEGALLQAKAGNDPVAQGRAAVTAAQNALAAMRAHANDFDPSQIIQARATLIQAEVQLAQTVRQNSLDLASLRGQIRVARAHGDPVAAARAAITNARLERQTATTDKDRLQGLLDSITANNDLEDAIKQREQDRYTYLESLTADPVKQAVLEVQRTAAGLKGLTPGTSAYYQAKTAYQNALRAQTQARVTAGEGDIDFELQMEHISRDEAVRRYQQLLQIHNLTKQQRRDILMKIKQLRDAANQDAQGFGLRVGDVKLPTVYDVRRAIAEGKRGNNGTNVNFRNNLNVHMSVTSGADVRDVFNELDRQLGTSIQSQMRSAGIA